MHIATSFEQEFWGIVLIVITVIVHALGMALTTISVSLSLLWPARSTLRVLRGINPLTAAFAMIVAVHLIEIAVWNGFFLWRNSVWTASATYRRLLRESVDLPLLVHWELLAGSLALLTLGWSGIVFVLLTRRFEEAQVKRDHDPASRATASK